MLQYNLYQIRWQTPYGNDRYGVLAEQILLLWCYRVLCTCTFARFINMTERNPQVPSAGMMVSFHNTVLNSLIHTTAHKDLPLKKKKKRMCMNIINSKRYKWDF